MAFNRTETFTWTAILHDKRGNFAMMTALVAIILVFAAGMGIDHMRALGERTRLQTAIDAAALAGSSTALGDEDAAEEAARQAFQLNYQSSNGVEASDLSVDFNRALGQFIVSADITVPTTLTRVLGQEAIPVSVSATAQTNVQRIEFVLAMDQSDSMAGNRQTQLLAALRAFVDSVYGVDDEGALLDRNEIFVGLIPWQSSVNPGLQNALSWAADFDPTGVDLSDLTPFSPSNLLFTENTDKEDVIEALSEHDFAKHGFNVSDDFTSEDHFEDTVFDNNIDPEDYPGLSWRGCLMARDVNGTIPFSLGEDRVADFDASVEDRDGLAASEAVLDRPNGGRQFFAYYHPPTWGQGRNDSKNWKPFGVAFAQETNGKKKRNPNIGCTTLETTYLTEDANTISAAIEGLDVTIGTKSGPFDDFTAHTDSSLGMVWALRMLDPDWAPDWGATFQPSAFDDDAARKVIILLSDGENGIGRETTPLTWTPYGDTRQTLAPQLNQPDDTQGGNANGSNNNLDNEVLNIRTLRLCELAKEKNVLVYTIAFSPDAEGSAATMLKNCATPDNGTQSFFFSVNANGGALASVFEEIANQATSVALTN